MQSDTQRSRLHQTLSMETLKDNSKETDVEHTDIRLNRDHADPVYIDVQGQQILNVQYLPTKVDSNRPWDRDGSDVSGRR